MKIIQTLFCLLFAVNCFAELNDGPVSVSVQTGTLATLNDSEQTITPCVFITADTPVKIGSAVPFRLNAEIGISTLPGEDLAIEEPATFKSARTDIALYRVIGTSSIDNEKVLETAIVGEWGWESPLLKKGQEPNPRLSRRYGIGVSIRERTKGSFLQVLYGAYDATGDFGYGAILISGDLALPLTDAILHLRGEAALNVGIPSKEGTTLVQKDVWTLGMVADLARVFTLIKSK